MKKLLLCLLISFVCDHALSVPQADPQFDPDSGDNFDEDDESEGTDDCGCVPYYHCIESEIMSDGVNILNPRRKPQKEEVKLDGIYVPPACGPFHVCCLNPVASLVKPYEHRCGARNPNGVNGEIVTPKADGEAQFGEWPWQAIIFKRDGTEFDLQCGGTLIDEKHVLTVAHCVDKLQDDVANVVVRLGEWDTQSTNELHPHEDFEVSEIITHPQYRSSNLFNDIAILKLAKEVVFKPHIDTACLPRDDDDFTGQNCVVTGFGTDAYKSGSYSLIMKEVNLPVIGHDECQNMLRKTRLGRYFKLHGGFLCAGGKEGEDSCKGDGGGPLVCYRSDTTYTIAGLVSWGIDCGKPDHPGVYVDVRKYIDWIASNTNKPIEDYWSSQEN